MGGTIDKLANTVYGTPALPPPPSAPSAPYLVPGNIDLYAQPRVQNPDGRISTVRSASFNFGGPEVLLPTVAANPDRLLTDQEAIEQYRRTDKHLGMFATPDDATKYAKQLHADYESGKYDQRPRR